MNLDSSRYPELNGPIVLLMGCPCPSDTLEKLHLLDSAVIEANAQTVEVIDVRLAEDERWWVCPWREDSMVQIFRRYTRKSYNTINKWRESDKFVTDVREFLTGKIESSTSLEQLPENWPELVSLVILDEQLEPSESHYTPRVFDGWFPHAKFRENRFQGAIQPIWRNAEVTPIADAAKPTPAEVLDWPLDQLHTRLSDEAARNVRGFVQSVRETDGTLRVRHLVRVSRQEMADAKFTDNVIEGFEEALREHHLWLGMNDEQIDQVRRGLVPTTPIAELKLTSDL